MNYSQLKLQLKIEIKRVFKRDSRLESFYLLSSKLKKLYINNELNTLIIDNQGDLYIGLPDGLFVYFSGGKKNEEYGDGQNLIYKENWNAGVLLSTLVKEILATCSSYVDIGGSNGYYYTLQAAQMGIEKIIVFEPNPKILNHLKKNIAINKFEKRIVLEPKAITSTGKLDKTYLNVNRGANSSVTLTKAARDILKEVPHCSIDEYFTNKRIHGETLMKIDVEGYELKVLNGALTFIKRHKPFILVEFSSKLAEKYGGSYFDFLKFFNDIEYTVVKIQGTNDFLAYSRVKASAIRHQQFFESTL
jgi:FkbM family methyltransferase